MPNPMSNLIDHTSPFRAVGPVVPVVHRADPTAWRQRVVNYAAKRYVDMMFVTGLDRATADRHFPQRPAPDPGGLSNEAVPPSYAPFVEAAWAAGQIVVADDAPDRRITVTWSDPAFDAPVVGSAIARPGYGGILLGPHAAPSFDPAPLRRSARAEAAWPRGDRGVAPRPGPALSAAADAFLAGSPGLYGVMVATPQSVLLERSGAHGAADRPTPSWSMTKAVTCTLIGRMIQEGWLPHVHDPAPAPLWRDPRAIHRLITLDHLLRMRSGLGMPTMDGAGRSGLAFENSLVYSNAEDAFETAQRMLVATVPGSVYRYINAGINVLGAIIRDQLERRGMPYHQSVYGLLADRIGMTSYQHSADLAGNFIASGSGFGVMRDYARLGLLYVQDGVWNGERLLPEGWADYALSPSHTGSAYAACFRSNMDATFPSLPGDAAWAAGASDQKVIILRQHGLVIVTTNETDHPIDVPALDRLAAAAIAEAGLPAEGLRTAAE